VRPRPAAPTASPFVRLVSLALIVGGVLLVVGALLADEVGLSWGGEGFGWKQLIATIVGLVLLLLGASWLLQAQLTDRPGAQDSFKPQE
jgi:hypothetical protein